MAEIVVDRVTKRFGDIEAVKDLSLAIPDGEFVVLLGPTGAGKTTLLRLIAGLETAEAGIITIDGRDATREPPALRDVSFVFQQYSLYPHLTVYDNLAFPLRAPSRSASPTSWTIPPRGFPAARCSAWRSGAPWFAALRSISWMSPCRRSMRNCGRICAWSSSVSRPISVRRFFTSRMTRPKR
jgi:ABC-type dipeptide/oligopeptide/nickel transport system ATPase subunit